MNYNLNESKVRSSLQFCLIDGISELIRTNAKVWEQILINQYGLGKNGGQLLNLRNSIAPKYWWQYGIKP